MKNKKGKETKENCMSEPDCTKNITQKNENITHLQSGEGKRFFSCQPEPYGGIEELFSQKAIGNM